MQLLDALDSCRICQAQSDTKVAALTELAIVMTVDGEGEDACGVWGTSVTVPAGYSLSNETRQRIRAGGRVTYATLVRDSALPEEQAEGLNSGALNSCWSTFMASSIFGAQKIM